MATFDPFEREFRRQAENLRQQPSPAAWQRLEQRLPQRPSRKRYTPRLQPWMIAATILITLSIFTLLEVTTGTGNVLAQRSHHFEELSTPWQPETPFVPGDYLPTDSPAPAGNAAIHCRTLTPARKYRRNG